MGIQAPLPPNPDKPINFLCIGIVCPRKNQEFTVRCFKSFAGDRTDVRLNIVGVRRVRDYEISYADKVEQAATGDSRIKLLDVTHEVDDHYAAADVVVLASLNEVTPMVLAEAMARGKPVLTTGIAGIPEMVDDGVEGFVCGEEDTPECIAQWASKMKKLADAADLRQRMGEAGLKRYNAQFRLSHMVDQYKQVAMRLAKPVVLVDMDGCLVDWDAGFLEAWAGRCPVDRRNYEMERCVPEQYYSEAVKLLCSEGFFRGLPPMAGGIDALRDMLARGYEVLICTSPVANSRYCAQEKWEWVRQHLGDAWLKRLVLTMDKTSVRGDVLIDDKPNISGSQQPVWTQIVLDAPYNGEIDMNGRRRLPNWAGWYTVVSDELTMKFDDEWYDDSDETGTRSPNSPSNASAGFVHGYPSQSSMKPSTSCSSVVSMTRADVDQLRDFSVELEGTTYLKDYQKWRQGYSRGAKGEHRQAIIEIERIQKQMFLEGDDWSSVHVYRSNYKNWRLGGAKGANVSQAYVSVEAAAFL